MCSLWQPVTSKAKPTSYRNNLDEMLKEKESIQRYCFIIPDYYRCYFLHVGQGDGKITALL